MADGPRENKAMLEKVTTNYEVALFTGDNGMWTVIETTERQIFKAPSQAVANQIIAKLKAGDKS